MMQFDQPAGDYPDPPQSDLLLIMQKNSHTSTIDVGNGPWRRRCSPGDLVLAPPDTICDYQCEQRQRFLMLPIPYQDFALDLELEESSLRDLGPLHDEPFRDPLIEHLCRRMWDEAKADNPTGELFADHAVATLVSLLLRKAERSSALPRQHAKLDGATLERVIDYMYAHIGDKLTLDELAGIAHMSRFHFARLFKEATGMAPHAYLIGLRVDHAREMLRESDMTVAAIAVAVGFYDQSQLARHFKRVIGVTPGEFRRQ